MNTKHTPGPWEVVVNPYSTGRYVYSADNRRLAIVNEKDAGLEADESRANARLFAAAPDLLDALELLMDYQNGPPLPSYGHRWNEAMELARAAIAKAEGATP